MKVKFCFVDSGTGEDDSMVLTVKNMSQHEFEKEFNETVNVDNDDDYFWELKSLLNHGDNWVATFTHNCSYFGKVLLTGIVYTNFK